MFQHLKPGSVWLRAALASITTDTAAGEGAGGAGQSAALMQPETAPARGSLPAALLLRKQVPDGSNVHAVQPFVPPQASQHSAEVSQVVEFSVHVDFVQREPSTTLVTTVQETAVAGASAAAVSISAASSAMLTAARGAVGAFLGVLPAAWLEAAAAGDFNFSKAAGDCRSVLSRTVLAARPVVLAARRCLFSILENCPWLRRDISCRVRPPARERPNEQWGRCYRAFSRSAAFRGFKPGGIYMKAASQDDTMRRSARPAG